MAIPNRQIGQSAEANLLWQIAKQLDNLQKVTAGSSIVTVNNTILNPVPVTGPLTDAELRTTPVNVLGPLTNAELRALAISVTGPLTNTELRAVPVNVLGPLTDTQLRLTPVPISPRPNTTGANGTTPYKLISLATTNANVVKASGGNLYSIVAIGLSSTVRYLKLYNKATAPIVGTDIPVMTIPIPANTQGAGISIPFSMGVNFPLGISIAITAGSADNDSVAILANEVLVNLTYA